MTMGSKCKAVFLDRDGVINHTVLRDGKSYPPPDLKSYEFLPGVPEAVEKLRAAGFKIIVATNQPDVGAGKQELKVVESMHEKIRRELKVDDIKACYHVNEDKCFCRKPLPGMLLEAAKDWEIDLKSSFMVGDRCGDVEAGHAAGCKTVMLGYGYRGEKQGNPDFRCASLLEACEFILSSPRNQP